MSFITLEKDSNYQNTKSKTNPQNIPQHLDIQYDKTATNGYYKQDTINRLNTTIEQYDFKKDHTKEGMSDGKIKTEQGLISTCLVTLLKTAIILIIISILLYVGFSLLNNNIELFPSQSNYTNNEFNEYLKRTFILLFSILIFICSIIMVIINNIVNSQFRYNYLTKINMYIFNIFMILINASLYIINSYCMFQIVDNLHEKFSLWKKAGTIIGEVNIDTINIFKYVIVSVIAIFIVINAFSICNIVHTNNKFILEEEM